MLLTGFRPVGALNKAGNRTMHQQDTLQCPTPQFQDEFQFNLATKPPLPTPTRPTPARPHSQAQVPDSRPPHPPTQGRPGAPHLRDFYAPLLSLDVHGVVAPMAAGYQV